MTASRSLPLSAVLAIPWLLALAVAMAALFSNWSQLPERDAVARAQALADMADAYRLHVTSRGGLYVPQEPDAPSGKGLMTVSLSAPRAGGEGQQKLTLQDAFLAVQDLARTVSAAGAAASLGLRSDNPLNMASATSEFERALLAAMRATGARERWAVDGPVLRYARALKADASCLPCHGDAASAPEAIRANYATAVAGGATTSTGFGYRVGDVVGLTAVGVELPPLVAAHRLNWQALALQLGVAAALATVGWLLSVALVCRPLRRRVAYAERLAAGDPEGAMELVPRAGRRAARELDRLDRSLEQLHEGAFAAADLARAAPRE